LKIFEGIGQLTKINNAVVTQGTFDGVHLGHQRILKHLIAEAKRLNGESVIITFYPHPRYIVQPEDNNLKLLSTLQEKKELLENLGIDNLLILPFDESISNLSPLEYVRDIIVEKIGPIKMIVGYDHRFGKNRSGSIIDLIKFAETFNFEVEQIEAEIVTEITVSSTKIRAALAAGNASEATTLLGYPYSFTGAVVKGMQLGRKMGYKTANILLDDDLKRIPGNGVYASYAYWGAEKICGMLSIGNNPTIKDKGSSIEIHLFNFDSEIYKETLKIEVVKKIRNEKKFAGIEALALQLQIDEKICKSILGL